MYLRILDAPGMAGLSGNIACTPQAFPWVVNVYSDDLVVTVECIFTWYWLADLCGRHGITFLLRHALYTRAIHGGKAKNDRIDAQGRHAGTACDPGQTACLTHLICPCLTSFHLPLLTPSIDRYSWSRGGRSQN
jgi:hypothetical protein